MKHNFLAWRHLDAATTDTGGGAIVKAISENFEKTTQQIEAVKTAHQKSLDEAKTEIKKESEEAIKKMQDELDEQKKIAKEAKEKADALELEMKNPQFLQARTGTKSYETEIEEKITEQKEKLGKKSVFEINLERKLAGDMSSVGNLTGDYFVAPDVRAGVVVRPYDQLHMRDLLPIGRTSSNIVRHLRDNGGDGGPGMVAEGTTKPQMDRDLSIEDAAVRKIGTHLRIPEEMIEDIPYLVSFITNIGTEEVMAVEDFQILYGDGNGQNLDGLFANATPFAYTGSPISDANHFDTLRAARMQMRKEKRVPSWALVSPTDYFIMTSHKDANDNYILQGGGNGLVPSLDGVPIVEMNQVQDGDFLLGDRRAAEISFRSNVQVRFYEQDRDNPIKNMVTIVIEERLALPIYYTTGFVKGTFSAAAGLLQPS